MKLVMKSLDKTGGCTDIKMMEAPKEVADAGKVFGILVVFVIARRNWAKADGPGGVPGGISEVRGGRELGWWRRFAREKLLTFDFVLLELFVGVQHFDDQVVDVSHKATISPVSER